MAEAVFDLREFEDFMRKFRALGVPIEDACNDYLHSKGYVLTEKEIYRLMPKSDDNRNGKRHAKSSKSLKPVMYNLGFEIKTQKKFNYLVFPNDALGTSIRNYPQEFFERALENTEEKILSELADNIISAIERGLHANY